MALKIISFIFVVSLAFGISSSIQIKDVPFDVNDVINRVSPYHSQLPNLLTFDSIGEFLIDTNIIYTYVPNGQSYSAIAFDGTNYLVVWQDERSGSGLWDIYGARVTPDGIVLDGVGIPISTATNNQQYPSVAFDGINYLVVWEDLRTGSAHIYGARVTRIGQVLDPDGISISTASSIQGHPSVTLIDTNYLVVWHDQRNGNWDIYGTRVTPTGTILDTTGIPISTATNNQLTPSVAFDGTNCLVVWSDVRSGTPNIFGARISPVGDILDDTGFAIVTTANFNSQYPSVTFGGTNYLVVWQDGRNGPVNWDIYGARVTQAGIVLDTNGIPMSTAAGYQQFPSVTFDDTNYLAVWLDDRTNPSIERDVYGTRISQDGIVLDAVGIPISTASYGQMFPTAAFGGTNYLVVWEDYRNNNISDIYSSQVTPNGIVLDPNGSLISTAVNSQMNPSIAFDGTNYLAVWQDNRNGIDFDIYGVRISQTGIVLDSNVIAISTAVDNQLSPSVTFDGTNFLVVWTDLRGSYEDIYGARVSTQGTVLDPEGIPISTITLSDQNPSVTFGDTNYLVTWEMHEINLWHIFGERIDRQGNCFGRFVISNYLTDEDDMNSSVAFDGTNYLVVWQHKTYNCDIYGSRVTQGGTNLDSNGITISTAANRQVNPSSAFDGNNYLVVWEDYRSGTGDIYGARVTQQGTVLDPQGIAICTDVNTQQSPSISFDGSNYLVLWQDNRRGIDFDIYGAEVNPSGAIIRSFDVSTQSGNQLAPVLAHGIGDEFLITYSGWIETINQHPANTMRIWGKFSSDIGIEEENSKVKIPNVKLFEVYPNPARLFLAIRLPQTADRQMIKIFDVSGKLVKVANEVTSPQSHKHEVRISLKGINSGIYFLKLGKDTKKFIVAK